eukprot:167597-Chlamydomonas_euryale.AAC.1
MQAAPSGPAAALPQTRAQTATPTTATVPCRRRRCHCHRRCCRRRGSCCHRQAALAAPPQCSVARRCRCRAMPGCPRCGAVRGLLPPPPAAA